MDTYLVYKPFRMLSQFSKEVPQHLTLADLNFSFPKNVYPVGRLDADSEGLLLLTNDKSLNARLLNPHQKQAKTYWVQVEGAPKKKDLLPLTKGISIRIKKKMYQTLPAAVIILEPPALLPPRNPPVRFRKTVPDTWLQITLVEGKNRQIRRMCAAAGFPVLRLVRVGLAGFWWGKRPVGQLQPGEVVKIRQEDIGKEITG